MTMRVHFEDKGQDLLYLDIADAIITGGGPFHGHIFRGRGIDTTKPILVGRCLELADGRTIRYPIERVDLSAEEGSPS